MAKQKMAWVSGSGGAYTLHVRECEATREFVHLDSIPFHNYRAAQDIANAINSNVAAATVAKLIKA